MRSARRSLARVVGLAAGLASQAALGHGAAPSALGLLNEIDGAPGIVRLSRGLARSAADGPRFICQSRWGGPDAALVAAGPTGRIFVLGKAGPFEISHSGAVSPFGPDSIHAGNARALVVDGTGPVVLLTEGVVTRLSAGEREDLYAWEGADSIALEDDTLLALRADAGVLTVRGPDGDVVVSSSYELTPTLETAAGQRFVRGASADGYVLHRIEGGGLVELTTSTEPLLGPVAFGGQVLIVADGALRSVENNGVAPAGAATARLSCLGATPLGLHACTLPDLAALSVGGGVGETLFALSEIRPPSLDGLEGQAVKDCQLDWLDIAVDAALPDDRVIPPEWVAPPAVADDAAATTDSCQVGPAGGRSSWLAPAGLLLCAWLGLRRRCWATRAG